MAYLVFIRLFQESIPHRNMLSAAIRNSRNSHTRAFLASAISGSAVFAAVSIEKKDHSYNVANFNLYSSFGSTQCSAKLTSKDLQSNRNEFSLEGNEYQSNSSSGPSLILPTLQASNRARRLVQTILSMILDYEKAKFEQSEFMENLLLMMDYLEKLIPIVAEKEFKYIEGISSIKKNESTESQQKCWEKEVDERKKRLEKAQHDYTTSPSEEDVFLWTKEQNIEYTRNCKNKYQEQKKKEVREAANMLGKAEEMLAKVGNRRSTVHRIAAQRLLTLCRENGGVYVKIGQHLANLDYLIPAEYVEVLSELFDDAPVSSYSDVREVIKEELGHYPEELFESFTKEPIASASLAQVHVATEKGSGRKLAVKVQHRGLRETSIGDLNALEIAVRVVDNLFDDFTYGWIVDEIAPNLPIELDFVNEGKNSEKALSHIKTSGLDCVIPEIIWNKTTGRILCMQFEEGFKCTNIEEIESAGLHKKDVANLISSVFNAQVFQSGFVHCDPHPANVLLREHPTKKGKPQIVLVDHGLYKQIDDDFRITYAELWTSLMMADLDGIKEASRELGIEEMYPLLAAMLTSRPFDEIIERSKSGSIDSNPNMVDTGDKAMIQGYVQRYIKEIFSLLNRIPRQMLLLLKMNDCLRHVDFALGSPSNTLVVAGNYASKAVFRHKSSVSQTVYMSLQNLVDYLNVRMRVGIYELGVWWINAYGSVTLPTRTNFKDNQTL